jgi:hypothetical protein
MKQCKPGKPGKASILNDDQPDGEGRLW